ncbi:MAG: bacillithiol biosynthesis cysteine-adding enzyme BshC [Allomuricauda sp.]|nr:MAG: bacillithiol biosynthesis cysteine-adding enzyme BshC [Allomuricauda sp.]
MEVDCIPFRKTGYFSELICDYLDEKKELRPFYNRFPKLENFKEQIAEKKANFPQAHRAVLVKALQGQYESVTTTQATKKNIARLGHENTFTVVTGHQLNLFTGPLYFLYKIVSTINLTKQLKKAYADHDFVPIYWMATEDHDFDEINYFNFKGQKVQWNFQSKGAVGRFSTQGLDEVLAIFSKELGATRNAQELKQLFQKAYLEHQTLTGATRYLANALFGETGLVIVDGDDAALKKQLVPYAKQDIFNRIPFEKVSETNAKLAAVSDAYAIQVNPREINYFYLEAGLRERIVEKDGRYYINDTDLEFGADELEEVLDKHPERFSPNVIARPLYQEVILPNLCYIGGGGELAYWLELKSYFEALGVSFPMLLLRNSALLISEKQAEKVKRMDVSVDDLFLKQASLINKKIRKISNIEIDFGPQKQALETQFEKLFTIAEQTDASFLGAVKAQEVKQKKGLEHLEKRLLKAQKRKLKDHVVRLSDLQNALFPNQSLQERQLNFSEPFLENGSGLLPHLFNALDPLDQNFLILYT